MDDHRESFEMEFVIEQIADGPGRLLRSIETHPDGSRIVTEYEEVPSANDRHVRSRQRTVGDGPPHEIVTEFLPSADRPPTYPDGFPFLAGRASHTTESPARSVSPGARWQCDDPEVVLAALIEASLADRWTRVSPSDVPPFMREDLRAAFRREDDVRLFNRVDHEQGSVIQMTDLGCEWLDLSHRNDLQGPTLTIRATRGIDATNGHAYVVTP